MYQYLGPSERSQHLKIEKELRKNGVLLSFKIGLAKLVQFISYFFIQCQ